MTATRSDADTTYELAQTLRYFTDSATVFALAAALILAAPRRRPARLPVAVAAGLSVLFVISSLVSTVTFVDIWRENPTRDYLANARMSLSQNQDAPLLEQPVAIEVLLPVAFPNNLASNVLAPLPDRPPEFSSSTPILRTIDDSGQIVDAEVTWTRRIPEGTAPNCGTRAEGPTELPPSTVPWPAGNGRFSSISSRAPTERSMLRWSPVTQYRYP